jgi:hypothetical protein
MRKLAYISLIAGFSASSVSAEDKVVSKPKVYSDVVACRTIADAGARLACFDAASKLLEEATESRNIVILDKGEVRKTKRNSNRLRVSLPLCSHWGTADTSLR